ncbi:MAG: Cys-tRNA(Pro) deacylase [Enterococcus aquimarinus]|uniref:Cys-tRNA(Pro)/Cys-tRNA(Cys) deacylase n=1 Tax=Enterococcus aquimarinus TaxID=328396 RepID=A0A9E3ZT44_9ENTE|nr:Cys-tRNA(Pro) deacylase [Enterococcus aquimarinus]
MAKKKESKTNALRIVEQQKIPYTLYHYTWSEDAVSANHVADQLLEKKEAQIFKTLLFVGNVTGPIVAVIPSNQEADLKKLAKLSGNKKVELLHLTELEKTTGYIRGGCSPVGMKKQFPTYLDSSIEIWDEMIVSAGRRGIQMGLAPQALIRLTKAIVGTIV